MNRTRVNLYINTVIFTVEDQTLKVILSRLSKGAFKGCLAIPEIYYDGTKTLEEELCCDLSQVLGLDETVKCEPLLHFCNQELMEDGERRVNLLYLAFVSEEKLEDWNNKSMGLMEVDMLLTNIENGTTTLAFEHNDLLRYARNYVAEHCLERDWGFDLLPQRFTLPELQRVYEVLNNAPLYKANFRKKMAPYVEETNCLLKVGAHRPSRLYEKKKI